MIENNKILNSGKLEKQSIEDNRLIRNPKLLKSIIDFLLLKVGEKAPVLSNIIKWQTVDDGYNYDTTALQALTPHVMEFAVEKYRGDRAKNNVGTGWYFKCGLPGWYRITNNLKITLGAETDTYVEDYIDLMEGSGAIEHCIYVNDSQLKPLTDGLTFTMYDSSNTETSYRYIGGEYIAFSQIDKILYLEENDKIDIRTGFYAYAPVVAVNVNFKSDINLEYINNYGKVI